VRSGAVSLMSRRSISPFVDYKESDPTMALLDATHGFGGKPFSSPFVGGPGGKNGLELAVTVPARTRIDFPSRKRPSNRTVVVVLSFHKIVNTPLALLTRHGFGGKALSVSMLRLRLPLAGAPG
jgi:hypothetical protein